VRDFAFDRPGSEISPGSAVSKLFKQLREAARRREEAAGPDSPGLLSQALKRADDQRSHPSAPPSGDPWPSAAPLPANAADAAPIPTPTTGNHRRVVTRGALVAWAALTVLLLAGEIARWREGRIVPAAPAANPSPGAVRSVIPSGLKLDYRLDVTRTGGAARSSLPDPARSK
jgi:hypothetical protein